METECGKPFDPNGYRCKTCGLFNKCDADKHKDDMRKRYADEYGESYAELMI